MKTKISRFKLAPDVDYMNLPITWHEDIFRPTWVLNLPPSGELGPDGIYQCTHELQTHRESLVFANVAEFANLEIVPKMGGRGHSTKNEIQSSGEPTCFTRSPGRHGASFPTQQLHGKLSSHNCDA